MWFLRLTDVRSKIPHKSVRVYLVSISQKEIAVLCSITFYAKYPKSDSKIAFVKITDVSACQT